MSSNTQHQHLYPCICHNELQHMINEELSQQLQLRWEEAYRVQARLTVLESAVQQLQQTAEMLAGRMSQVSDAMTLANAVTNNDTNGHTSHGSNDNRPKIMVKKRGGRGKGRRRLHKSKKHQNTEIPTTDQEVEIKEEVVDEVGFPSPQGITDDGHAGIKKEEQNDV